MFSTMPNFKPIFFNSTFLSLEEARSKIEEKYKVINEYKNIGHILFMDDYELYDDQAIEVINNRVEQAKEHISYLREQLRCWNLVKN